MTKTVSIEFRGVDLDVSGEYTSYTPAKITADPYYSSPAEGGTFEVESIEIGGVDIIVLLGEDVIEDIKDAAYTEAEENDVSGPEWEDDE